MAWDDIAIGIAAQVVAEYFRRRKTPRIIAFYEIYPHKKALRQQISSELHAAHELNLEDAEIRQLFYTRRPDLNAQILQRLVNEDAK